MLLLVEESAGKSHLPANGSMPRRERRMRPSSSRQTALAVGFELA
jgi:hypothetical protein